MAQEKLLKKSLNNLVKSNYIPETFVQQLHAKARRASGSIYRRAATILGILQTQHDPARYVCGQLVCGIAHSDISDNCLLSGVDLKCGAEAIESKWHGNKDGARYRCSIQY